MLKNNLPHQEGGMEVAGGSPPARQGTRGADRRKNAEAPPSVSPVDEDFLAGPRGDYHAELFPDLPGEFAP